MRAKPLAIRLLEELIAIDSVNPTLVPGGAGEREIAEFIANSMRRWGVDVVVEEAAPGRPNVVGVLDSGVAGRTLMLCGHTDTVGVAGMEAPFTPVEKDGRIYGRGAHDMKGGLAAMLDAARGVAERGGMRRGKLIVAVVADEECLSIGAEALVQRWTADAAIVGEPTDLAVATAHKGFEWVTIETEGVAAHGSRPEEGVDAIAMMGRVLTRLESHGRTLGAHPRLGRASLHASLIEGGRELSTYPDRCTLQIERRTLPGEPAGVALGEVEALLHALRSEDARFAARTRMTLTRPPYETPETCALPRLLGGTETTVSFWTDAAILGAAGIPSVVYGPGGAGLHGPGEYVRVSDVLECSERLAAVIRAFCEK
jgi:acetylornithine deacetylase